VVDPSGPAIGAVSLQLYSVPTPPRDAIKFSGTGEAPPAPDPIPEDEDVEEWAPDVYPDAEPITVTTPGENAVFTFTGAANQRVSALVTDSTVPLSSVQIYTPDGEQLVSIAAGQDKSFLDTVVLPEAGAYKLVFDPNGPYAGSASVTLFDVPPDPSGEIRLDEPVSTAILTPGQNARLTFDGIAGKRVAVHVLSGGIPSGRLRIEKVDGTDLASMTFTDDPEEQTLTATYDTTGRYYLVVDASDSGTGQIELWMTDPDSAPDAGEGPDDPNDDVEPIVEPVPDDGTACTGSDASDPCVESITVDVDDPTAPTIRQLSSASSVRNSCDPLVDLITLRGSHIGRFGWKGDWCLILTFRRTNTQQVIGEAALKLRHKVRLSGTRAKVEGWAKLGGVTGIANGGVSVTTWAVCLPSGPNPGTCSGSGVSPRRFRGSSCRSSAGRA
jgi:hypothetical protein